MNAKTILDYLERVQPTGANWKIYIHKRSCEVKTEIFKLRALANKNKSTRVAKLVNEKADRLQCRLDDVLARFA